MDRNSDSRRVFFDDSVALRKESVDRNPTIKAMRGDRKASLSARRAWIEISARHTVAPRKWWSLSARRAWIEITRRSSSLQKIMVALRKESVDRNYRISNIPLHIVGSLSARRAWIEIAGCPAGRCTHPSLSARRAWIEIIFNC